MYQLSKVKTTDAEYGGKINSLVQLSQLDLPVPDGLIISSSRIKALWENIIEIKKMLQELGENRTSEAEIYEYVNGQIDSIIFPESIKVRIGRFIQAGKKYIVRSSGLREDNEFTSFAGQYLSIPDNYSQYEILEAVKQCMKSMFSEKVLRYWRHHEVPVEFFGMAVLIQEQIPADLSGVTFSMDPATGQEDRYIIEYIEGSGHALTEGEINPYSLSLKWLKPITLQVYDSKMTCSQIDQIRSMLLLLVKKFGYPVDCEFCYLGDELYLLQVRPITGIPNVVEDGSWTNANFRDGGVAAQDCPDLMWSLYRDAWQKSLSDYLVENHFFKPSQIGKLALLKYARPYWNVGIVKEGMKQIPGYNENQFNAELGISSSTTERKTSPLNQISYLKFIRIVTSNLWATRKRLGQADSIKENLLEEYKRLQKEIQEFQDQSSLEEVEELWRYIINDAYMESETTYFTQVFINTVQIAVKKSRLLKYISEKQLLDLLSNIGNVSHTRPYDVLKEIADSIGKDSESLKRWTTDSVGTLAKKLEETPLSEETQRIKAFQRDYGYHSLRELDLRIESFAEDSRIIIGILKNFLMQEVDTPQGGNFTKTLKVVKAQHRGKIAEKLEKDVLYLRKLLWWREEFKDISTRYYHLIRQISLVLADHYVRRGILLQKQDIFYLKREYIEAFMDSELTQEDLKFRADYNQAYCIAFRNMRAPDELRTETYDTKWSHPPHFSGIGANSGTITSKVRILKDHSEIETLKPGEILVTKFIDTGWSTAFPKIGGIITETGGVLSHAAIVAREYGIPVIVNFKHATEQLRTGMTITMDGSAGSVLINQDQVIL